MEIPTDVIKIKLPSSGQPFHQPDTHFNPIQSARPDRTGQEGQESMLET